MSAGLGMTGPAGDWKRCSPRVQARQKSRRTHLAFAAGGAGTARARWGGHAAGWLSAIRLPGVPSSWSASCVLCACLELSWSDWITSFAAPVGRTSTWNRSSCRVRCSARSRSCYSIRRAGCDTCTYHRGRVMQLGRNVPVPRSAPRRCCPSSQPARPPTSSPPANGDARAKAGRRTGKLRHDRV